VYHHELLKTAIECLQYLLLSVLLEVTVGDIACGILHIAEYVLPDVQCIICCITGR
jgi:hypothetical protein